MHLEECGEKTSESYRLNDRFTSLLKFAPCWQLQEQGGCWTPPVPTHPPTTRPIPASQSLDIPHWLWQGLHYFAPEASAVAVTAFESLTATEYTASVNGQEVPGVSSGSVDSGSASGTGTTGASIVQMPSAESYARMALLVAAAQALPGVQAMAAQQPPPAAAEPPPLAQAQRVGVGQGAAPAVVVVPAPAGESGSAMRRWVMPSPWSLLSGSPMVSAVGLSDCWRLLDSERGTMVKGAVARAVLHLLLVQQLSTSVTNDGQSWSFVAGCLHTWIE